MLHLLVMSNPPACDLVSNHPTFFFLGLHPLHMEVPRLGVELELELPAYAIATTMPDPSWVCGLR